MKPTWRVRQRASSASLMPEMQSSPTKISPPLGRSSPAIRLRSVVLPEPDGPISARNSPSGTSRLSPKRTLICSLPRRKNLCTSRTVTMASGIDDPNLDPDPDPNPLPNLNRNPDLDLALALEQRELRSRLG